MHNERTGTKEDVHMEVYPFYQMIRSYVEAI